MPPHTHRSDALMRLTFDQSPVPMARLAWADGEAGVILDANNALGQLLGSTPGSLVGAALAKFVHPAELGVAIVAPLGEPGQPRRRDARLVRTDGKDLWVSITAMVVEPNAADSTLDELLEPCALVVIEDVTARRSAEASLTRQALHDPLTGLLNRYALTDRLASALTRLYRSEEYVAVIFCDLDGFKHLNDTLGHRAGDELLITIAERLRAVMRPMDTVARLGGDEFVMVCQGLADPTQAKVIGERIREAILEPFTLEGRKFGVTMSVGIATTADASARAADLLRRADLAMYRAKDSGRNRVEYYIDELETRVVARVEATEALRRAITDDRIAVQYQPVIDVNTARIVGLEALARVIDEQGEQVMPADFISVAESSGLIAALGERVLDIALDQLVLWQEQGSSLQLNVNISPRQLSKASFASGVAERLRVRKLPADSLCLEVTESAVVDPTGPTLLTLRRLRSYGIKIGIDDFGTGYSSLTTLKYLPADVIKIDRSFVEGLGEDRSDAAIVRAVINVAHELRKTVIAEGVESSAQAQILSAMGCDELQGFRYSEPIDAADVTALLADRRWPRAL